MFKGYNIIRHFENIEFGEKKEVHTKDEGSDVDEDTQPEPVFCMFCGKQKSDNLFTKIAHAVPESVGNKTLTSNYECNKCNEEFGNTIEDSFGKYMFPYKFITRTFGKKKSMVSKNTSSTQAYYKMQTNKNKSIFEGTNIKTAIFASPNADPIKITDDGFNWSFKLQNYCPQDVYFTFVKMALSILPLNLYVEYIQNFAILMDYVTERKNGKITQCCIFPTVLAYAKKDFDKINVSLWEKSITCDETTTNYPDLMFVLQIKYFIFAIPIFKIHGNFKTKLPPFDETYFSDFKIIDFNIVENEIIIPMHALKYLVPKEDIEILIKQIMDKNLF